MVSLGMTVQNRVTKRGIWIAELIFCCGLTIEINEFQRHLDEAFKLTYSTINPYFCGVNNSCWVIFCVLIFRFELFMDEVWNSLLVSI